MARSRIITLAALGLQSSLLGILVHIDHGQHRPEQPAPRAASLILTTELLKLAILLLLALFETAREKETLAALLHDLPRYRTRRDSGHLETVKEPYRDEPRVELIRLPPPPRVPIAQAVRPPIQDVRAKRTEADAQITLDAPLTPFSTAFPAHGLIAPSMRRSEFELKKVVAAAESDSAQTAPLPWAARRELGIASMLVEDLFAADWWIMAIPAVLFAIQNNLLYVAARTLSVPVFQIILQLKPPVTALFAIFMLGRRLAVLQWIALAVLGLGTVCMHVGSTDRKAARQHGLLHYGVTQDLDLEHAPGIAAAILSIFVGGAASTYFEMIVKRREPNRTKPRARDGSVSLWNRCIQLSLLSCFVGLCLTLVQGDQAHLDGISNVALGLRNLHDPLQPWYAPVTSLGGGFLDGFTPTTWMIVGSQALVGILTAATMQQADTLVKDFALAISMVIAFAFALLVECERVPTLSYFGAGTIIVAALSFRTAGAGPPFRVHVDRSRVLMTGAAAVALIYLGTGWTAPVFDWVPSMPVIAVGSQASVALVHSLRPTETLGSLVTSRAQVANARLDRRPTVAVVDMSHVNDPLVEAAHTACKLGARPYRESTWAPFGFPVTVPPDYPYWVMRTDQYALDDILTTRFATYDRGVPLLASPPPDFLFLPLISEIWANAWGCKAPELEAAAVRVAQFVRDLAKSAGDAPHPRIVLPIATIRSNLDWIFTPQLMAEFRDKVVLVSIENAPKMYPDGFKYLIDVPYPTAFHLSERTSGKKVTLDDYYFNNARPYLLHYGAAQSHPWGQPASDPFNGFALRETIARELRAHQDTHAANQTASKIAWDDITNSVERAENLSPIHAHMERSRFCLMPAGDSPSRRAFYEAIQLGCIPVIFRERSYGRLFPSSPELNDVSRYTIFIDEAAYIAGEGPGLIPQLEDISLGEIRAKQEQILKIAPKLQWALPELDEWIDATNPPDAIPIAGMSHWNRTVAFERMQNDNATEDAFVMLLKELTAIRDGDWKAGEAYDLRRTLPGNTTA